MYFLFFCVQALALSQSSFVFRLNCLHYLNQTLVSVVCLLFKTLFNYISVALDKENK